MSVLPPARVVVAGAGMPIPETTQRPAGALHGGSYDKFSNTLFLGGSPGHAQGTIEAGGDPSLPELAGISVFERSDAAVFWANDSKSLPAAVTVDEGDAIHAGLEVVYGTYEVYQLDIIGNVPK